MATAASIGGFGAAPAPRAHQTASPYFRLRLAPGARTTVVAIVDNSSDRPIPFKVVPVAGLTGETSGAVYGNRRHSVGDALTIRPAHRMLVLPAHTRRLIHVSVSVGVHARPGDHLAGLAIVDRDHRRGRGRFAVIEIVRVVLGVSVRVPGAAHAQVRIGHIAAEQLGGTADAAVRIPVRNVGGLYCRPRLRVSLVTAGRRVTQHQALGTILPHTRIAYPMAWRHRLSQGTYEAKVTARGCGTVQRRRQRMIVATSRPAAPLGPSARVIERTHDSRLSWPLLALVGLGGLGAGALVTRRRRTPPPSGPADPLAPLPES